MQVNKYNFLTWTNDIPETGLPPVPWLYHIDRLRCGAVPVAVATEAIGFYINNEIGVFDETVLLENLELNIIKADNLAVVASNIYDLEKHIVTTTPTPGQYFWNPWSIAVLPTLPEGFYRMAIRDASAGANLLVSSLIYYIDNADFVQNHTTYCRFKHDRYFYGVKYHEVPGFFNQFRMIGGIIDEQTETEKEIYREVHTGKRRAFNEYLDKWIKFELYYLSPANHDAASIYFEMDFVELNGDRYRKKSTYTRDLNNISKLNKGAIELYDEAFSAANRC